MVCETFYAMTNNIIINHGEKVFDGGYDYYMEKRQQITPEKAVEKPKVNDYKLAKELESQKPKQFSAQRHLLTFNNGKAIIAP